MELELTYDSADQIPTGYDSLYTERGGKMVLTGINGMKSQGDVDRLQNSLNKERDEHKETKESLRSWKGVADGKTPEEMQESLDEMDELRIKADGKDGFDETKMEELVSKRVDRAVAKVQRNLDASETTLAEMTTRHDGLVGDIRTRDLRLHLEQVGRDAKLRPEAMEDWMAHGERLFEKEEGSNDWVAKEGVGVGPGQTADLVLGDLQEKRPHWWPDSVGGGAKGGKGGGGAGGNPWTRNNWNFTTQSQYVAKHGMDKARAAAEAAGSKVGNTKPPEK